MNAPSPGRPQGRSIARLLAGAGLRVATTTVALGALAIPSLAHAQPVGSRDIDPGLITGRGFVGLRLAVAPSAGPIELAGRKAYAWTDGTTRRLLLVGDVRVRLGEYTFTAARALFWLERVDTPTRPGGGASGTGDTYQVFGYMDRVGSADDAAGGISLAADRLPVQGILTPPQGVVLRADAMEPERPPRAEEAFQMEGEAACARVLRRLVPGYVEPPREDIFADLPKIRVPAMRRAQPEPPSASRPYAAEVTTDSVEAAERVISSAGVESYREPIFAKGGLVTLSAGDRVIVSGAEQNSVMATGGVSVQYDDRASGKTLALTAQRAVLFLAAKRPGELTQFKREDIAGIYLEGDVIATDGRYTLRGPQIYYDLARNRAVVLDAVFWTYDERRRMPLYVRADSIRQESAREFRAEHARLSTSAFFEPEFSIGASSVTISRAEPPADASQPERPPTEIDARDITLRAGAVPFFYWPRYTGDPAQVPLRDIRFENSSSSGFAVKTRWNPAGLLGIKKPDWLSTDVLADYYAERGLGAGGRLAWDRANMKGEFLGYALPNDTGTDTLRSGITRDAGATFRGVLLADQRWKLDSEWTLLAEASYLSDPSFADVFFPELATQRRELTNRVALQRIQENTAFTLDAHATFNDFIVSDSVYQSQGYVTQRLPEATYVRQADDVLPALRPGLLTHTSEYRAGYVSLAFDETQAKLRGLSDQLAQRVLGVNSDQSPADRLRALGLNESGVWRMDSRQEISAQFHEGPLNIQPFAVGRLTMYDSSFAAYEAATGANNGEPINHLRLFGGGGVRVSTQAQRVSDGVDSRLFDLHRLRHIVEPSITVFGAGTTTESTSLPTFDDDVENLVDGEMIRVGALQTWQTQRGGPGRWHSVDVLTLNTDLVYSSHDAPIRSPIGRFDEFRPELSNAGDFFEADAVWQASDTLSITGATVYDLDLHQPALSSAGVLLRHSPQFSTFVDSHYVNSQDQTIIAAGANYELTTKYTLGVGASWDATRSGFQGTTFQINRRFESTLLGATINYDEITGVTSFGFLVQPFAGRGGANIGGIGGPATSSRFGG